jgi:hypothetical protein
MQYSPNNEQGLLSLVAALKQGMDPGSAVQMLGMIEQDQATQVAQRQERLGGLADLLMGAAQGGMTQSAAAGLAEAAPGPAGPAVDSMLSSLYPESGGAQAFNAAQSQAPDYAFAPQVGEGYIGQQQSPAYTQNPQAQMAQQQQMMAMQQQEMEMGQVMAAQQSQAAMQEATPDLMSDASKYARDGRPLNEFMAVATQAYPEFFVSQEGIELFQQIVSTAYAGTGTTGV